MTYRKKHVDVVKLMHCLRNLDAPAALNACCRGFNAHQARIKIGGDHKSLEFLFDLPIVMNPEIKASSIQLDFLGGPPGDANWHKGNLLMLLVDFMAFAYITDDKIGIRRCLKILGDKIYG